MDDGPAKRRWMEEVIEEYQGRLIRYATRVTGDVERAREVVQDTFLRLWESAGAGIEEYLAQWLFTVCRNRSLDVQKKNGPLRQVENNVLEVAGLQQRGDGETHILQKDVMQALCALPVQQQEVIRLKFQEGFSYKEISEITGHSISNVGYLIHIGIRSLRETLGSELPSSLALKRRTS